MVKMAHTLAEFLLSKGYIVHGVRRYSSTNNLDNLSDIMSKNI